MRILNISELDYNTDWMHQPEVTERSGREFEIVDAEYEALVTKLEPGENFIQAMYKRRILERDDGKYQIVFRHEDLPESMRKWHAGDYVFRGLMTDLMPLQVAFSGHLRELDNW